MPNNINNKSMYKYFIISITLFLCLNSVIYANDLPDSTTPTVFNEVKDNNISPDLNFNSEFPEFAWWDKFNDTYLSNYINKALNKNFDLNIAKKRIEESRAIVREALGHELPSVSINPSYTRQQNSASLTTPTISQFDQAGPKLFSPGSTVNIFNIPLVASYEADIWLKNRNLTQAQKEQLHVIENNYNTTVILVSTEVASTYFKLISTDKLIELQENEIKIINDNLKLTESLYNSGLVSEFDTIILKERVLEAEKNLTSLLLDQKLLLHQLSLLLGETTADSETYLRKDFNDYQLLTELNSGVPSDLVTRRPDIMAAESSLKKAQIEVKIARKEFLPRISLSGQFGYATTELSNLFDWKSHLAAFTASMAQSIFSGGSKKAHLKAQKSNYEALLETYNKTIFQAFKEVDDSIAMYKHHYKENTDNISRVTLSEDQLSLANSKYEQGLSPELDLNEANIYSFEVKKEFQNTKLACFLDYLNIIKSLGGGF